LKIVIENVKNTSDKVLIIDGCPINCAEKIMKDHGLEKFTHINITDFGITKGKTPVTDENIDNIIRHIRTI